MRHLALLLCLAGAMGLLSFGFAEPFEQVPDKVPDKVAQEKNVPEPKAEKAKSDEAKARPAVKPAPKAEMKKAAPGKAAAKKESKTPVADLLNAAVEGLFGDAEAKPAQRARQQAVAVRVQAVAAAKQMEQQYAGRFRQLYRSELHFMRVVCQPTRQQFEKIAAAGDAELQASIKKLAEAFAEQQQGRFGSQLTDPRKLIAAGIAKRVKADLSAEQAARYEKEVDERTAVRRRVVIVNLLSGMDKKLILTVEQRDKVNAILEKNWNDSWNQIQLIMQGGEYFPAMPDDKILPILTETQKKVWRDVQKGNVFFGGSDLDMVQGIDVPEEVWSEPGKKK
jgi:hypothetical protein